MEVATERRRFRFLGVRTMGAVLAFLLLSMCTTFRPAEESGSSAPAADGAVTAKRPASGTAASAPVVSSLPTVAAPASGGAASLPPSAADLPTPSLPISIVAPQIPEPQLRASLLASAVPTAALVGVGEAIAGATGVPGGVTTAGTAEQKSSAPSSGDVAASAPGGGQSKGGGLPPVSLQRSTPGSAPPEPSPRATASTAASPARAAGSRSGYSSPAAPRAAAAVPFAAPTPPSPAAAPPAATQATPAATSSPASSTASTGARPASSNAPAQTSVPASSGSPPAAAPAGAPQVTRSVFAQVGDDITIALDGVGWTFTGGGPSGNQWKQGLRYKTRTVDGSGTTFTFKATSLGKWTLAFQQQDTSTGTSKDERVNVDVLTKQEFARALAAERPAGTATTQGAASSAGLAAADWLYKEGKYREALDAYEKVWKPGEPALTDKIAELAYRVGRYRNAREYWQKNFGLHGTAYGHLAVAGLMKTATAERDAPELRALFDSVHALPRLPSSTDLLAAARYLVEAKQWEVALRYLEEYLRRYNGGSGADVADYLLGQIYEGDTPMQNARKALEYYREIVDHYPTSSYYDRARANIVYLRRQFFEIR